MSPNSPPKRGNGDRIGQGKLLQIKNSYHHIKNLFISIAMHVFESKYQLAKRRTMHTQTKNKDHRGLV